MTVAGRLRASAESKLSLAEGMNPALRMGKPPRAKVACEEPQDEGNDCARTVSACSGMPLVAMDDDEGHLPNPVLDYEGDEVDLKLTATAFAAHERLRRSGRGDNYFGKSTMTRFFKLLMGHPDMLRGIMLWMPDRDPFERLSGVWAAMSVYGSLVGVCALSYGMPDASSSERTLTYHISSSIMLCASMFLIIPVCQLTVLTVFFSTVPAHQMRQQLSKHRWITSVTGPIHLIATQIFAVGMVIRYQLVDAE